nr:transposase [Streptomyces lunaelactis]
MFSERTSVGLDVHARTTMAWALDGETGEVFSERLDAETHKVLAWVATLPQPAAVAYEAGPTGFVLARALDSIGLRCVVAAPSKMERPAGDRIKTDKRDAQRLAKLLRMDELPVVRVPTLAEEAARDLVRGRDDVRRDLARARNRISKLLLRQGRVWRGGSGWTYIHHEWLRKQRFDDADTEFAYDNGYEEVLALETMRDRFDQRITDAAAAPNGVRSCAACPACAASTHSPHSAWPSRSATGSGSPARPSAPTSAWCPANTPRAPTDSRGQSPRPATAKPAACWSRRRGTTTSPYRGPGVTLRRRMELASLPVRQRADLGNRRLHQRWEFFLARKKNTNVAAVAVARELAGWCWSLAVMD